MPQPPHVCHPGWLCRLANTVAPAGVEFAGAAGAATGAEVPGVEAVPEVPVPGFAVELPGFELAAEPEPMLLAVVVVAAENGFVAPEPHPTAEAIAIAPAPTLSNTLEEKCTLNPRQP